MLNYIKQKGMEIFIAGTLFLVLVAVTPSWMEIFRKGTNPVEFFEVKQVYVPDFEYGKDPEIVYDRSIKQNFTGTWNAELQLIDGSSYRSVCRGHNESNYSPNKMLPDPVTLSYYLDKENLKLQCPDIVPGKYRLETVWVIHVVGYPEMSITYVSNVFEIKQ